MLTSKEVAEKLSVHPSTVRRWIREGKIESIRFGRDYKIPEEALEKFIRDSTEKGIDLTS